ncbi:MULTISPECIES: hypothetical protein, partial [unclassified Bradyrhizobium]|uniref:hypothetical protein n=1 Tax=unclassified Bradyrhizobium TaxID=2631580 RepID=UPI001FF8D8BE
SSSGRRGHAPILDADPLRSRPLITADVGAHTGYGLGAVVGTMFGIRWHPGMILKALGCVPIVAGLKLIGVY